MSNTAGDTPGLISRVLQRLGSRNRGDENIGGGGPERASFSFGSEPVDPIQQKINFLTVDVNRVPDYMLEEEMYKLYPDISDDKRQALVARVLEKRHPQEQLG